MEHRPDSVGEIRVELAMRQGSPPQTVMIHLVDENGGYVSHITKTPKDYSEDVRVQIPEDFWDPKRRLRYLRERVRLLEEENAELRKDVTSLIQPINFVEVDENGEEI